jgi:effector-binding domain-containing protein
MTSINKLAIVLSIVIIVLIAAYLCFYYISMRSVKEPKYQLVSEQQAIQVRRYQPILVAEVAVQGERKEAVSKGFRLLANYIFGNNSLPGTKKSGKISMTAPVIQQESSKIAMTAPVMQTESSAKQWLVRFVMPSDYTLKTLPKPNNKQVKIIEEPARTMLVIRFSGSMTKGNLARHLQQLNNYVQQHKLQVIGEPVYAFYNPPWTLPIMRRNEIMYQLKP